MKKTTKLLIVSILAIGLFVGCTGEASSTPTVVKIEATQAIDVTAFDSNGTGAVTKNTEIKAGNTGATMAISEGTVLEDIEGNAIQEAPTAKVKVEKSATKVKTTLNFETADGKKVIPAESVVMSVPAPTGAKPGDKVKIEVPDDGTITQKFITIIVKADGTVDIRIFPKAFKKTIVIVVLIIVDNSTN